MNDTTDTPKLSWWRRLSSGLKRTSTSLGTAVADLVTKRKLDRAMLEDIEDVLLRADLGTDVAARIAEAVQSCAANEAVEKSVNGGLRCDPCLCCFADYSQPFNETDENSGST